MKRGSAGPHDEECACEECEAERDKQGVLWAFIVLLGMALMVRSVCG